jgi:hypothetical protein
MAFAQTVGTRALQNMAIETSVTSSVMERSFVSEMADEIDGKKLYKLVGELDKRAAKHKDTTWRMEHTDSFCLLRDLRYANRSGRWLRAKAIGQAFQNACDAWRIFATTNQVLHPEVSKLPKTNINEVISMSVDKVFKQ